MPRPSGKAAIRLKGNAKNLPDIYFRELVQLYSRDCRTRGIEEVTIAGYEYACKKFLGKGQYLDKKYAWRFNMTESVILVKSIWRLSFGVYGAEK